MVLIFFFCCLILSVPEKFKNLIFEIPIIPQTLNISNQRTTSARSIILDIIRKLIEYSLKNFLLKTMFNLIVFEILLFKRSVGIKTLIAGYREQKVYINTLFPLVNFRQLGHQVPCSVQKYSSRFNVKKWLQKYTIFANFSETKA